MFDSVQTSGGFLMTVLGQRAQGSEEDTLRCALARDVYIKQRSYMIINKIFWALALPLSLVVVVWPLVAVRMKADGVDAAVAQTVVTALDGFAIYFYQFYKKRQVLTENLLRRIVFSKLALDPLVEAVMDEMNRIDQGFGFPTSTKKGDDTEGKEARRSAKSGAGKTPPHHKTAAAAKPSTTL